MLIKTSFRSRPLIAAATLILLLGGRDVASAQSLLGGTGVVIKRVFVRTARRIVSAVKPTPARGRSRVQAQRMLAVAQLAEDTIELADNAIELGNAQRDVKPPRYAEAERAYHLAEKINPQDARPKALLGDVYFEQQRFAEAEAMLRRAVALDPADAISYVRLSYMFSKLGRFDEADETARLIQALKPDEYYGYCTLGWSKFRQKNYGEAEAAYRRAIELSPKTSGLYSDLGLVLASQERLGEATAFFLNALEVDSDNLSALINYGVVLQKLGRFDEAITHYARAAKQAPAATQPRSNLGTIYYMKNDAARAREEWEAATRLGSAYALDRTGLLILDRKLGEARAQLEEFTRSNAANGDGWLMLGDVLRALNDTAGAEAARARAAQVAPDYARLPRPVLAKQFTPSEANTTAPKALGGPSREERQPLVEAASQGRTTEVQTLLAGGADANASDKNGGTALMMASAKGHTETVKALLKAGADANAKDQFGQTALMYAAGHGYADTVKLLLAKGADIHAVSNRGATALRLAQGSNRREAAKELMKAGARE